MKSGRLLENLIYLTIFFIPLYLIRIQIWIFPTNILEIIIGIVFLVWFFYGDRKIDVKDFFYKHKKYIYAFMMMMMGILISTIINGNNQHSWGIIKSWFVIPMILLFLCEKIIKKEKINQIFLMYFFSTTIVALISLGYFILGYVTYDNRLTGIFISPNYLAMYLMPAIIIFVLQERKNKIRLILPLGIILIVLYLTYSYASWLAIITSLLFIFFWENRGKIGKFFYFQVLIILVVSFFLFFSQVHKDKFISLANFDERSSLASRMMIWRSSIKIIENNFWLGIGAGNFQKTYLEYQKFYPPYLNWAVSHPNNLYLTWWLYGGIFSLGGFFSLVFFFLQDVFHGIYSMEYSEKRNNFTKQNLFHRAKKEPNKLLLMALGIMLIILIHGLFDTTYFKNDLAIVFWLNFLALKT